jgi:hypothetical protein
MPSASLSFRLPEDQEAFDIAQSGWKYKSALGSIDSHLRNRIKYGELPADVEAALQAVRDELHRITDEIGVEVHR